jgi:mRNA-degrading endonuclease RelE of RelBE toxin-antitoxin system
MTEYKVTVNETVSRKLLKMDGAVRERLIKVIAMMRSTEPGRHLKHGLDFFVEEVGQYRIVFRCINQEKRVHFVGDHKEYEKWYRKAT